MAERKQPLNKTYEEYQAMAALLGRFYFGYLHLFLGKEWPFAAMNPDTMEMMKETELSAHEEKHRDKWTPSKITEENSGWHRWMDQNGKR